MRSMRGKRAARFGIVRASSRDLAAGDGTRARELSVVHEWPRRRCGLLLLLLAHGVEKVWWSPRGAAPSP
jgi:hypothetical protein